MKFCRKMHLGAENSNWLGATRKLMSELFQEDFIFLSICLLAKVKTSNVSAVRFII